MSNDLNLLELILHASLPVKIVMLLLLAASVASWFVIFRKRTVLNRAMDETETFEERFWSGADMAALYREINSGGESANGMSGIFESGFREFARQRQRKFADPRTMVEGAQHAMRATVTREVDRLEQNLEFLATVGSASPYVGLFGTVWGIMHALQNIGQTGTASLDVVAGPIGEALVATAIGIATALPAVLAYNFFLRRLKVHVTDLENFAHDFMRLAQKHDFKL